LLINIASREKQYTHLPRSFVQYIKKKYAFTFTICRISQKLFYSGNKLRHLDNNTLIKIIELLNDSTIRLSKKLEIITECR